MSDTAASKTKSRMVTGLFPDRESAESAYGSLTSRGYGEKDVNLVMSDETRNKHFAVDNRETELGNKALKGAGTGAGHRRRGRRHAGSDCSDRYDPRFAGTGIAHRRTTRRRTRRRGCGRRYWRLNRTAGVVPEFLKSASRTMKKASRRAAS